MRICLCDDERVQAEQIQTMLKQANLEQSVSLTCYRSAEEMLFECQKQMPFDLILLDVQMERMNGIELAKKIREINRKVAIVFLTGMKEYAYKGYEVEALRYVIKPLTLEKFKEILALVKKKNEENRYLIVEVRKEKIRIDLDTLLYAESRGHTCLLHTYDEDIEVRMPFSELVEACQNECILSHRTALVSLSKIERIGKDTCVLEGGVTVPVSRGAYKELNEAFIRYYQRKMNHD